ncbi:hypothetical protein JCM11641_001641 [Rhodosporidiobolus odoratus]
MSCCCHTPEAAALGASILVLIINVPTVFYSIADAIFNWEDVTSGALRIFTVVALGIAVGSAILGLVGRRMKQKWTLETACYTGVIVMFSVLIVLTPIGWMAYEFHAYGRQVKPSDSANTLNPVAGYPNAADIEAVPLGKGDESVSNSLARAIPFGRTRRGSTSRGRYGQAGSSQRAAEEREDAWRSGMSASEDEGSLLSSDGEMDKRSERKRRAGSGRY